MVWRPFKSTRTAELVPLAAGVTGQLRIAYTPGMVTLIGRDIVMPGAGLIAELPQAAFPIQTPLYGLLGRTGSRLHATFDVVGLQLTQGTSHTTALYFVLTYPRREA